MTASDLSQVASPAAGVVVAVTLLALALGSRTIRWPLPSVACGLFLAWSIAAMVHEGPLGFWSHHVGSLWETQIWMDLLLAASVAWVALLPRLRSVGMRPVPWLVLVLASGSIGLLALLGRLLHLEERRASEA